MSKFTVYTNAPVEECSCVKSPDGHRFLSLCDAHLEEVIATDPMNAANMQALKEAGELLEEAPLPHVITPREVLRHLYVMAQCWMEQTKAEMKNAARSGKEN